jgi:DNA-binding XRE family transcriptional regulator
LYKLRTHILPHYATIVGKVAHVFRSQLGAEALTLIYVTRIRELREERAKVAPAAFTQAALAQRVGVSINALRAWEAGTSRPRQRMAKALARELNVTVDELGLDEVRVAD